MTLLQTKPEVERGKKIYSLEEYYHIEENSEFRHEYHQGEIVKMSGVTINHNQIIINLIFALRLALQKNSNYKVYSSDLRLYIPTHNKATYPNIMVIEGEVMLNNNRQDEVLNPCLIIEVLSPSTENYDRGDKFRYYRSIPTLKQFLLISQSEYTIESYVKTGENQWLFQENQGENIEINLESVGVSFPLLDLYTDVNF